MEIKGLCIYTGEGRVLIQYHENGLIYVFPPDYHNRMEDNCGPVQVVNIPAGETCVYLAEPRDLADIKHELRLRNDIQTFDTILGIENNIWN